VFLAWNNICDSILPDTRLRVELPGWRIARFIPMYFEPGGPQRENACGRFILRVVGCAAKPKE
jgi:hypothetical protein